MTMKPLFLIPVNLTNEIDLFAATKERIEAAFDVELGVEAIELYSEKEIDANMKKLERGEDLFDYSKLKDIKIGEVHSIFQREILSSITIRDNPRYLEHSLRTAKQIIERTKNSAVNVNSHLSYFIPVDDTSWFKVNKQKLLQNITANYRSVLGLLSEGLTLTVENMDDSRWFKTDDKLAIMPLDTSFRELTSLCSDRG
jgi:hypothetical protein